MTNDLQRDIVELLPRLRRFAYALTGSRDDGDDLVQTACLKALTRLEQFEPGTRLDSWLFRIMHTSWIDKVRAERRRNPVDDPDALAALPFNARIHERAEAMSDLETVRDEMGRMSEDQRTALALVTIEGMSYQEAAELLDIPVGTVVSRLSRARKRLCEALDRTGPSLLPETRQ